MATTTTNFGWPIPQSTDLVKDGATAIAGLGSGVDTSMAQLKGGTTGQMLTKTSNTDMAFTWITPQIGDITAVTAGTGISGGGTSGDVTITNSMATTIDAKGDLIAGTGNDAFAKLTVGSDGSILVANSAASTGLGWAGQPYQQPVLNSAMQIWQRGTSISVTSGSTSSYTADRWLGYRGATNMTVSRQTTSDTTNLPNIQYCARVQRTAGDTNTVNNLFFQQNFETINSIPYAGKTITFSFYAKKGANYSATSSNLGVQVWTGTGTDQLAINTFTGASAIVDSSATLTTTWQRFTYTGTVGSTATQLAVSFYFAPTGTAGAADYYEVTGVQIDLGSIALPFRTYAANLQGELAACQRYYYRQITASSGAAGRGPVGSCSASTNAEIYFPFPVTMRVNPSALEQTGTAGDYSVRYQATSAVCNAVPNFSDSNVNGSTVNFPIASGPTAGNAAIYRPVNTNAYLGWSAEL